MASFLKGAGQSGGNKDESEANSGPSAFFRKLRENVSETMRPVPGMIKLTRSGSGDHSIGSSGDRASSLTHAAGTPTAQNSSVPKAASANSSTAGFDLNTKSHSGSSTGNGTLKSTPKGSDATTSTVPAYKITQFENILNMENVDLAALKKLSWNGIPSQFRTQAWQLMLGYLPTNKSRRDNAIARKRKEYLDSIAMYFDVSDADRTTHEGELMRQIQVDLPRTCPDTPLFQQKDLQRAMERILYVWSIRHPASGYVQGMNDLLAPMLYICISPFTNDVLRCDIGALDPKTLMDIEADTYWCLTKLLDNIQDHYTFSQPGLQRMILRLEDLVHRLDSELHEHFESEGLQYMQFSFRWMNCILLRELPLRAILRLWDTYLSEESGGFENFHVYVCVVLLKLFKEKLMTMQFQDILMFLQEIPTSAWGEEDIEPILSQAYILSTLFENSPNHLG